MILDHVALLVESVMAGRRFCAEQGYALGPVDEFPAEGTRECYVGEAHASGRLLLMEPIADGPYRRAMAARGPGLHHIGIAVPDLDAYVLGLPRSSWYLHPRCLPTLRTGQLAWLARPGTPLLVEVAQSEASAPSSRQPFCTKLEIAQGMVQPSLLQALGLAGIVCSSDDDNWLAIGERRLRLGELLAAAGCR